MKNISVKNKNTKHIYSRGLGLIEIIVGTSIITLSMVGLITTFSFFMRAGLANTERIKAIYILEESTEAFRYMRDAGWTTDITTLSKDVPYHLVVNNSNWEATTTESLIDDMFDRTITIVDVYRRNSDSDIVASTSPDSKTLDPNTVEVTAKVAWNENEVKSTTYLTNIFNN